MTDMNSTYPTAADTASSIQHGEALPRAQGTSPYGANLATPTHVGAPRGNPLGVVAFVLAVVMLVAGAVFTLTTAVAATGNSFDDVRLLFLVQALTNVVLSIVVVVLASVSLVLKNRRRLLGAIALGAGGFAFLGSVLSFVSNSIAAALT